MASNREGTIKLSDGDQGKLSDLMVYYQTHPEQFVREIIGVKHVSNQQTEALSEIAKVIKCKEYKAFIDEWKKAHGWKTVKVGDGTTYVDEGDPLPKQWILTEEEEEYAQKFGVSIMAGKGVGKDTLMAWLILFFLCCFERPKIPCISPRLGHLKDVLWSEVMKWYNMQDDDGEYCFKLRQWISITNAHIFYRDRPKDAIGQDWRAFPKSAAPNLSGEEKKKVLAGLHEDNMLFCIDEAASVDDAVFDPLEDTLTSAVNLVFMIFNPTQNGGYAVKSHYGDMKKYWSLLQWSAEDSDIVSDDHIARMLKKYGGRDTNGYRINVLGLPPNSTDGTLIPWNWVNSAVGRKLDLKGDEPVMIGVDVARHGGDKTVILVRKGGVIEKITKYEHVESPQIVREICAFVVDYEESCHKIGGIFIDVVGLGGPVKDLLKEELVKYTKSKIRIVGVDVARKPVRADKFMRMRDELWWKCRRLFEYKEVAISDHIGDSEIIQDFVNEMAIFKYEEQASGKVKVEGKDHLKRRVGAGSSPDMADAFVLTLASRDENFKSTSKKIPKRVAYKSRKKRNSNTQSWMAI